MILGPVNSLKIFFHKTVYISVLPWYYTTINYGGTENEKYSN